MNAPLLMAVTTSLCMIGAGPAEHPVRGVERAWNDLPQTVTRTLQQETRGRAVRTVEELRYHGLPILFRAALEGEGRPVLVRTTGELITPRATTWRDDVVTIRPGVRLEELPPAAAAELRRRVGDHPIKSIEEIGFAGVALLFEIGLGDDEGDDESEDQVDDESEDDDEHGDDDVEDGESDDDSEDADDESDEDDDESDDDGDDDSEDADDEDGAARHARFFIDPSGAVAMCAGDLIEREVALGNVSRAVAESITRQLDGVVAPAIQEIRFEGIAVLYLAQRQRNSSEREIAVDPRGRIAAPALPASSAARRGLEERKLDAADLPRIVAATLHPLLADSRDREIDEIRFAGIPVLYEAEMRRADGSLLVAFLYPDGQIAEQRIAAAPAAAGEKAGDDDDDESEDDDESDDDDDDDDSEDADGA